MCYGGARGVMVVENGHGDTSSNPGRGWEESWRLEETCYHSDYSERPSAPGDVKNSPGLLLLLLLLPLQLIMLIIVIIIIIVISCLRQYNYV